ncbi:uncharacterized protein GGS25DRAFT_478098 [Hypoxylon fragiforme]|uniref:uncharacterized protein n=1 Tax=Hypoxylon fragiforme TaxID=63214 RepID=UPI0020C67E4D|nr:uncharacterized protein GGS25DRAFT_478098 [Hypoxylon fragiforme]KAI2613004.1 hypothetical protein GGS25DRAFT_478098 [Hypoxylon fragiforme]
MCIISRRLTMVSGLLGLAVTGCVSGLTVDFIFTYISIYIHIYYLQRAFRPRAIIYTWVSIYLSIYLYIHQ